MADGVTLSDIDPDKLDDWIAGVPRKPAQLRQVKRRYSVTADILSYRRCKRQYGFFARRGYTSAQSGQLFFGTIIHQTLDRAHAHFRGEIPGIEGGSIPSEEDIARYFAAADRSLRAHGIRPLSRESQDQALRYLTRFNSESGPNAYPRILDSEHYLQKDKGNYVLHGVVDVVAESSREAREGGKWSEYEIWDYKGSKRPKSAQEFEDYEFQMRVYAHLYEIRNGTRPRRALLLFLGEEDRESIVYPVSLSDLTVGTAVEVFEDTVSSIEASIASDDWSKLRRGEAPSVETCDACDLRWSCPAPEKTYRIRAL